MKEFNFRVFLGNEEVANIDIDAKDEKEANIIIKRQYPPSKGFKCKLTEDELSD